VHKIIPLALFVSVSLIIGNQAAFAETNIWGFYGEFFGSKQDAANPGPLSSIDNIANTGGDGVTIHPTGVATYQNVANAMMSPGILSGPTLVAKCFEGIPNPEESAADWIFGGIGNALPFKCIQNQRNAGDLGLGVKDPAVPAQGQVQELEVEVGQLVVIDLTAILPTNPTNPHTNFMFRISSNSMGEKSWVATSDKPPENILIFPGDFTPLGPDNGFFAGCETDEQPCANNDAYISFIPEEYLYYTQTTRERDNLLQQIKADKIVMIGGELIPLDTTMVLLGATKTTASWMIPVLVAGIGIGIVIVRKF